MFRSPSVTFCCCLLVRPPASGNAVGDHDLQSRAGRAHGRGLGLRFSLVNLTHMIIPLAFGTLVPRWAGTVFLANSALMLGGGYAHHRGAKK
jgi:hypothetical protein